jgi:hypothetical protein
MKQIVWLAAVSLFLLTGCVAGSSKLAEDYSVHNENIYKESITIRDKIIPLPMGDWKIIANGETNGFFKLYLLQEHEGKIFSYIRISVDTLALNREGGYAPWKALDRTDMHYVVNNNNSRGEAQDGWYVNNNIVHFAGKNPDKVTVAAAAFIKSHGYIISNDMIRGSHRLTGKHPYKKRYLSVHYYYNPEADGFSPGQKASWTTSDWNAMRVNEDQRKVEYIENIIAEQTVMHKKMKAGFHP